MAQSLHAHTATEETAAKNPIVTIEMENGSTIKAELYPQYRKQFYQPDSTRIL